MPRGFRVLLPVFALAAGTWLGLGKPGAAPSADAWPAMGGVTERATDLARSWTARARATLRGDTPAPGAADAPPPVRAHDVPTDTAPTIDPKLLPDPTPWPQLNPEMHAGPAWVIAEGPAPRPGDGRRYVTFTFDDGPFPETTPVVLHVLAKHHVHATFFWIGRYLEGDSGRAVATRAVAKEVVQAGHLVGNHTYDHRLLLNLSRSEQMAQIDDSASAIERAIGRRPVLFRPPFGQLDPYSEELLKTRGQTLVLWSVEAQDMKSRDAQGMFESLRDQLDYAEGGIVLLHDIRFTSAEALDKILDWLDERRFDPRRPSRPGFVVVDLPAYLRAVAASPQPYTTREELEKARAAVWRRHHARSGVPAAVLSEEPAFPVDTGDAPGERM